MKSTCMRILLCLAIAFSPPLLATDQVTVSTDDSKYTELQQDHAKWQKAFRTGWDKINLDRFAKERHFHGGIAKLFLKLSPEERASQLKNLQANPLTDKNRQLLAVALLGDMPSQKKVAEIVATKTWQEYGRLGWFLSWFDWNEKSGLSAARKDVLAFLNDPDPKIVQRVIVWLKGWDAEIWRDVVIKNYENPKYLHHNLLIDLYAKVTDKSLPSVWFAASKAVDAGYRKQRALREFHKAYLNEPEQVRAQMRDDVFHDTKKLSLSEQNGRLRMLFQMDATRASPIAEQVFTASMQLDPETLKRMDWIVSWILTDQATARKHLLKWTDDSQMGITALRYAAIAARGTRDAALAERYYTAVKSASEKGEQSVYVLAAIGGVKAIELAGKAYREQNPRYWSIDARWAASGIDLIKACRIAVANGVIPRMPTQKEMHQGIAECAHYMGPYHEWIFTLEAMKCATKFDLETSAFPNEHDRLILTNIAKASQGLFTPTRAVEVWRDKGEYYDVTFELNSKWYHFQCESHGDWYDLAGVLNGVNFALRDQGHAKQFFNIESNGATLILAEQEALKKTCRQLGLSFGLDAKQAREQGLAFEKRMKERLGLEESPSLPDVKNSTTLD